LVASGIGIRLLFCHRLLPSSLCWPLLVLILSLIIGWSGILVVVVLFSATIVSPFAAVVSPSIVCFISVVISIAVRSSSSIVILIVDDNRHRQCLVVDRRTGRRWLWNNLACSMGRLRSTLLRLRRPRRRRRRGLRRGMMANRRQKMLHLAYTGSRSRGPL
jgi:hypothetical protein